MGNWSKVITLIQIWTSLTTQCDVTGSIVGWKKIDITNGNVNERLIYKMYYKFVPYFDEPNPLAI